jgi:cell division protein ZapB
VIDLLTKIRSGNYSDGMISDFHRLAQKVNELAALTQSLRLENADLRLVAATLSAENAELTARIDEACQRVVALLETIPAPDEQKQEAA